MHYNTGTGPGGNGLTFHSDMLDVKKEILHVIEIIHEPLIFTDTQLMRDINAIHLLNGDDGERFTIYDGSWGIIFTKSTYEVPD